MVLNLLFLAAIVLGHGCVLIVTWNLSHSLPLRLRDSDRLMLAIFLVWLALSALLGVIVVRRSWNEWPLPVQVYAAFCAAVAVVGLPVSTLLLRWRRTPEGLTYRSEERLLAAEEEAHRLRGRGFNGWLLRLPRNEWLRLQRAHWRIELPGLPPGCAGLSVAHVSDLHFARCFDRAYFDAVAEQVAEWSADLVLFTGDLIDDDACLKWIEPVFSRMRGRLGQYAILGNHDYAFDIDKIRSRLAASGFTDLDGRWTQLDYAGAGIVVGGTSAPWGPKLDMEQAPAGNLKIVLSHTPDLFSRFAARGVDIVLSGHNHGGQVRLPLVGPVLMPSRYNRRFDRGFFRAGRTLMHVSQGVAGKHPIRYGCPPEISRFVLMPARHHAAAEASYVTAGEATSF